MESFVPITSDLLAEFDVLWTEESSSWTQEQADTIAAWLRTGGGLLRDQRRPRSPGRHGPGGTRLTPAALATDSRRPRSGRGQGDMTNGRRGVDSAYAGKRAECDGGGPIPGTRMAGRQEFAGTLRRREREFDAHRLRQIQRVPDGGPGREACRFRGGCRVVPPGESLSRRRGSMKPTQHGRTHPDRLRGE